MERFIFTSDDFKKQSSLSFEKEKYQFDVKDTIIISITDYLYVSFTITKYTDVINVTGKISGDINLSCARCLSDFIYELNINFDCSFGIEEDAFDVGEEIRQNIILNLPVQPLCNNECKGICQICGNNKNVKSCSCDESNDEFVKEKWSKIKNLNLTGGRNAESKKKTYSAS